MIFGIGTDVLELSRIKNPELLAKKILTKTELQSFNFAKNKQNFVAKRFSVKEAVAKALGVGIGKSVSFKDIEILKTQNGKPVCIAKEDVLQSICQTGNVQVHVSITDTKTLIQTFAIVEILK